jgi:hypothetical protein
LGPIWLRAAAFLMPSRVAAGLPAVPWQWQDLVPPVGRLVSGLPCASRRELVGLWSAVAPGCRSSGSGQWWLISLVRSSGFHGRLWGGSLWCGSGPRRSVLQVAAAFSSGAWGWQESGMDGLRLIGWPFFWWWLSCNVGLTPCSRLAAGADDGGAYGATTFLKASLRLLHAPPLVKNSGANLRSRRGLDEGGVSRHSPFEASFLESAPT